MSTSTSFTVGRDAQAVLIGPNGARFDLSGLTDFDHKAKYAKATSKPLDSPERQRSLPIGHEITLTIDRTGPANEIVFAGTEAAWWAVGSADPGTSEGGALFLYINEINGSQTTHQFSGVSVEFGGLGNYTSDSRVVQKIDLHAQRWAVA